MTNETDRVHGIEPSLFIFHRTYSFRFDVQPVTDKFSIEYQKDDDVCRKI